MNFRFLRLHPLVSALPSVLLLACSSSSTTQSKDAGHPHDSSVTPDAPSMTLPEAASDAGSEASGPVDAGIDAPIVVEAGLQTWSSLYRDYFGPGGHASCAGDGMCHGGPMQPGYANSGFLCPKGDASTACWTGITSQDADGGAGLITPDAGFAADYLDQVLCQDDGLEGEMPKFCSYSFSAYDLARIGDWVNAGALDN